jgi:hypothetical protein
MFDDPGGIDRKPLNIAVRAWDTVDENFERSAAHD